MAGSSYTVRHSAGGRTESAFGWWIGLTRPGHSPEEWGPRTTTSPNGRPSAKHTKTLACPTPFPPRPLVDCVDWGRDGGK